MRLGKEIYKWIICLIFVIICLKLSRFPYFSLSPLKAHQQSERVNYYGPSEVVEEVDVKCGKVYLCKYKDWFSASTVKRHFIFWAPGSQVCGSKINSQKKFNFTWYYTRNESLVKLSGFVNDENITEMQIMNNEFSYSRKVNEKNMFIICLEGQDAEIFINNPTSTYLVGKNANNEVIVKYNIHKQIIE